MNSKLEDADPQHWLELELVRYQAEQKIKAGLWIRIRIHFPLWIRIPITYADADPGGKNIKITREKMQGNW